MTEGLNKNAITHREREVIQLIAEAQTNRQIAAKLHISVYTVKRHVANIFAKTGAVSRLDAVNKLYHQSA